MKKLISIIVAVGILLSSFMAVSAAVETFEDGGDIVIESSSIPSSAEVIARSVTFNVSAEKITAQDTVKNLSNRTFSNSNKITERDIYQVTVTFSNLGELANGYGSENDMDYIGIGGWQVDFPTTDILDSYYKNSAYDSNFTITAAQNSVYPNLFTTKAAVAAPGNPYPQSTDGEYMHIDNATISYSFLVSVALGDTVEISGVAPSVIYILTGPVTATNTLATTSLTLGESAPATVDVESVTISGATAATVGDDVQLSATVAPDNATDKTVTWTKVSGNGDVSSSGVVTATAAGDVVVKATAGGVDSANYTVSFAAPAPTPVYTDSSIDVKKPVSGTTGLTDLQGNEVTLTANYGIAKFSKAIDTVANNYFVVATDSNDVEQEFSVDFAAKGVEISNASTTFFAIVKSADHIIKSIRLKEIAK